MASTLRALRTLQQVELQLKALRDKIDAKQRAVRGAKRRLQRLRDESSAKHEEIMHRQAAIAQLELDVQTHDDEITKLRDALNRSKTNKEYAAILTQINTDKADTSKLEERILELMGELEVFRQEEEALGADQAQEQARMDNALKAAEAFAHGSQAELEALQAHRDEAAGHVPASALAVFERASERHDGEVLAHVVQPHPKRQEFMCDGCNMSVTLEQFVALQSRDDIQICHSCARVLCLEDALVQRA